MTNKAPASNEEPKDTNRLPHRLPTADGFASKWEPHVTPAQAAATLAAVRQRAEAWRTGTATILGLITAALVVTDVRDSIGIFDQAGRITLATLLGLSAVFGLASLFFLLRAANGPSWLDTRVSRIRAGADAGRDLRRARGAAADLRLGQAMLAIAVLIFVALVALTWIMEPA